MMDPLSALLALLTALVEQESLVIAGASPEQRLEYARLSLAHRERLMALLSPLAPASREMTKTELPPPIYVGMTPGTVPISPPQDAMSVWPTVAMPAVHGAITPQIAPDMTTKDGAANGPAFVDNIKYVTGSAYHAFRSKFTRP
jgi:hypothetical protein